MQSQSLQEVKNPDGIKSALCEPCSVHTRWGQEPFILGSYAQMLVRATGLEFKQLSQPIAGRVYFAGEALHPNDPGTVHGAFWSGEQAVYALESQFNQLN